jgi:hypothetical protein
MAFARGIELANDLCGQKRIIRGEIDSLNIISIINKIVNIPIKLALKIIQGKYSQSNKLSAPSVQNFLRGQ